MWRGRFILSRRNRGRIRYLVRSTHQSRARENKGYIMELFILIGGCYALYTVGMAIASHLDYREVNRK